MTDRFGNRLQGRAPYAHDADSVIRQFALTFMLLELSRAAFIILCGTPVREEFVRRYKDFENGEQIEISGIMRTVFHIRHMEHTWTWATADQLEELLRILQRMEKRGIPVDINLDWVKGRIKLRHKELPDVAFPPSVVPSPAASRKQLQEACRGFKRKLQPMIDGRKTEEFARRHSAIMRALHADPNGPFSIKWRPQNSENMRALHADPNGPFNAEWRLQHGETKRKMHADPSGPYNEEWAAKIQARHAEVDGPYSSVAYKEKKGKAIRAARQAARVKTGKAPERYKLEGHDGKFEILDNRRAGTLPPLASDLSRPELLYHLWGSMDCLGLVQPKNLEGPPPTTQRPWSKGEKTPYPFNYKRKWFQTRFGEMTRMEEMVTFFADLLFAKRFPVVTHEERKAFPLPVTNSRNERKCILTWAERISFAEDVYLEAQKRGVVGTEAVYKKRTGLWDLRWDLEKD